jgi:hypothetical protein
MPGAAAPGTRLSPPAGYPQPVHKAPLIPATMTSGGSPREGGPCSGRDHDRQPAQCNCSWTRPADFECLSHHHFPTTAVLAGVRGVAAETIQRLVAERGLCQVYAPLLTALSRFGEFVGILGAERAITSHKHCFFACVGSLGAQGAAVPHVGRFRLTCGDFGSGVRRCFPRSLIG